jgi:hypothetical protein
LRDYNGIKISGVDFEGGGGGRGEGAVFNVNI